MGYTHDTGMSQFIGPMTFHYVTGTYTFAAGAVAGTIALHVAGNNTHVVTIPIVAPSNSVGQKGALLKSIEVDYEILTAEPTSMTWTLNKVSRGADLSVAVVAAVTKTNALTAANGKAVDQHKEVITITTPAWIANTEYYLLELSCPGGAGGNTIDFLGAIANYTLRI